MFKKRFMILLAVLGIFILPFSASAAVLLDQPLDGATPPAYTSQWAPDAVYLKHIHCRRFYKRRGLGHYEDFHPRQFQRHRRKQPE